MDTLDAILTRSSVRAFTEEPVSEADLHTILQAGMSGPSCVNARDWAFYVARDKETLNRMADANGPAANPLRGAALGILICGDLERAFPKAPDYWVIDAAIAAENMALAAHALGLGCVWLGTWPQMERVQGQASLLDLPEHLVPHTLLAIGHPAPGHRPAHTPEEKWEEDRVHYL